MGICMSLRATKKRVTPQGSERAAEMGNALLRALLSLSRSLSLSRLSLPPLRIQTYGLCSLPPSACAVAGAGAQKTARRPGGMSVSVICAMPRGVFRTLTCGSVHDRRWPCTAMRAVARMIIEMECVWLCSSSLLFGSWICRAPFRGSS